MKIERWLRYLSVSLRSLRLKKVSPRCRIILSRKIGFNTITIVYCDKSNGSTAKSHVQKRPELVKRNIGVHHTPVKFDQLSG